MCKAYTSVSYIDKKVPYHLCRCSTLPPDVQTFMYNPLSFLIFVMPGQTDMREMMMLEDVCTRTSNDGASDTTSILGVVGSDVAKGERGDNPQR
jgi:DNA-binding ferritin-like protein (Dps family)